MPKYDYFCDTNGQTVEVSHTMTTMLRTWGELCDTADIEAGTTPMEAPLRRVFAAPLIGGAITSDRTTPSAAPQVPCQPRGCPCCN